MGTTIAGRLSVRVDNATGIRDAVRHLVEVHGKQNIGFIRGPALSDEAEVRYAAYREALAAHGIDPDPRWVAEGDYNRPSGGQAVRSILDQKRVSVHALDALVCANDYMALGALDELARRGISVPEQIALIGFDDMPSAAESRPALTTIRQPAIEQGREGLKQLVLLASGATPAGDSVLPVELKIRRSCGCTSLDLGLAPRPSASGVTRPVAETWITLGPITVYSASRVASPVGPVGPLSGVRRLPTSCRRWCKASISRARRLGLSSRSSSR
jgi:hypothetical protein